MPGHTGYRAFDTTVDKTNRVLVAIEQDLGWSKELRNRSYATLHALRDRLAVEEAAQFGAPLPMLTTRLYYDGWDPARVPVKMNRDEFMARVRRDFPYDVKGGVEAVVATVPRAAAVRVRAGVARCPVEPARGPGRTGALTGRRRWHPEAPGRHRHAH